MTNLVQFPGLGLEFRMAVVQILPDGSLPSDETEGEDFEE